MTAGGEAAFVPRPAPTVDSLEAELSGLRERMMPFLREAAPTPASLRRSQAVESAEHRLEPSADWQSVPLPHYGGPIGRARAWYRMSVDLCAADLDLGTVWVCFGGVDYRAAVFFNGQLAGAHEGFFSPFEVDVTAFARLGANELLVRVDNDAIQNTNAAWGRSSGGDKIYGATGLGWNEPGLGWHHCPPGMGIHRPVRVEARPRMFLQSLFVRPLPHEDGAEAWVEVFQTGENAEPFALTWEVRGRNFDSEVVKGYVEGLPPAEAGTNRYRLRVNLPGFRWWSPDEPWLYRLNVTLASAVGRDTSTVSFGMRTFVLDESPGPDGRRGRFVLNGSVLRLRGANTMGHEQQCVLRGDMGRLRDDILLAKLCHLNFLRFTQRPVEPEVYDMCDRLGMMAQTDLPLFGYLRRGSFAEALRQAVEMERLVRSHPSNVLASFINEPFPAAWGDKSHRHLTRPELESFFQAASAAMRVENPDRQIKPIDGDYEPPGPGLPDGHCYAGWYNGHGLDLGQIHKGFWLPVKEGWNYACGEFGSEGLDDEQLMREAYPASWLPQPGEPESAWTPARIAKCQTGTQHGLWFEAGGSIAEWVRRSREHQFWVTRLMTEAFRRDNRMVGFAIHLLIDAWPAGWMKTLVDCRRRPKPAFFAYRDALTPLAAFLRMDRSMFFEGETVEAEVWVCNDTAECPPGLQLAFQLEDRSGSVLFSARHHAVAKPGASVFQGRIVFEAPRAAGRTDCILRLGLLDNSGHVLHDNSVALGIFPSLVHRHRGALARGEGASLREVADYLPAGWIVMDDPARWSSVAAEVEKGAVALFVGCPPGEYEVAGSRLVFEPCGMEPRHFVGRSAGHPLAGRFREGDFRFWHDAALDRPSPLLHTLFHADASWRPILDTVQGGWHAAWQPALAAAEKSVGAGKVVVCQVVLAGRLHNPVARLFLDALADCGAAAD